MVFCDSKHMIIYSAKSMVHPEFITCSQFGYMVSSYDFLFFIHLEILKYLQMESVGSQSVISTNHNVGIFDALGKFHIHQLDKRLLYLMSQNSQNFY